MDQMVAGGKSRNMETFMSKYLEKSVLSMDEGEEWAWTPKGKVISMAGTLKPSCCGRTRDRTGDDLNWDDQQPD
jgi:hypothetical protein